MRKRAVKDTEKEIDDEHDLDFWRNRGLYFCTKCFHSAKEASTCIKCGEEAIYLNSLRVRPPRQKASKMRWREFFEVWLPNIDFSNAWERRKLYLKNR